MSKNIVDAVIDVAANHHNVFSLLPTRRQIDWQSGYVNNWTTTTFMRYVANRVHVHRDHAGPMQGTDALDSLDTGEASLIADVQNGLRSLHIDPWRYVASYKNNSRSTTIDLAAKKTAELINCCEQAAGPNNKNEYEIGTEEMIYWYDDVDVSLFLKSVKSLLTSDVVDKIKHIVIQAGNKIEQTKNCGKFDSVRCSRLVEIADENNLRAKDHNSDYLTLDDLRLRIGLGVSAFNFAPELGVLETIEFIRTLDELGLHEMKQDFITYCVVSQKWVKWVGRNKSTDLEKAIVCGHYQFSQPWFVDMHDSIQQKYCDFDNRAKDAIKRRLNSLATLVHEQ